MDASPPPSAPGYYWTTAPMRNGLGVASLACGLIGILLGQVPFLFLGSGALGILAIVFGIIGIRRAARGEASNRGIAVTGLVTGGVAFALAIWGVVIIVSGLNTIGGDLDHLNSDTGTTVPASRMVTNQEGLFVHQSMFVGNS
jgi:hypothetical protein